MTEREVQRMRSFDPRRVGSLECRAWETYYRRRWAAFLIASVVRTSERASFDPARAATLEVEWWRAHRESQRADGGREAPVAALRDLYAYSYGVEPETVRPAAELRAEAMEVSDRWVEAGCDPSDPLLAHERSLLIRSFAALLAAVHRP